MRNALSLALALTLSCCGSSPETQFHELASVPPSRPIAALSGAPIAVEAMHMPELLDRLELVRRSGPTTLQISDVDRWGAPLGAMARRVLSEDMAMRLPAGMIVPPDAAGQAGARAVVVSVAAFDADPTGHVRLAADWSLLAGTPATQVLRRREAIEVPGAASFATQPAAMSNALAVLADRIVAALAR